MTMISGDAGKEAIETSPRYLQNFVELSPSVKTTKLTAVRAEEFDKWLQEQSAFAQAWVKSSQFSPKASDAGKLLLLPEADGSLGRAVVIVSDPDGLGDWLSFAGLPTALPKTATYEIDRFAGVDPDRVALAWGLGCYSFDRYKGNAAKAAAAAKDPAAAQEGKKLARLVWPAEIKDRSAINAAVSATYMVRDLISTPAEDMGPANLQAAVEALARTHRASTSSVIGGDLLREGYPQVHAVGRAAADRHAPRLLELVWGSPNDPKVTLVGKGVCFDTGGLDIKPAAGMRTMKKDMGGAAQTMGLAHMIMASGLPVRLRLLIPAVENAISGDAFRPGDILVARNGLTSEIGNTDAEGRLVLADALVAACEEDPALLVDCATLTGAGRVALGTDVPAVFVNDDKVAAELAAISAAENDLVWRLPLFKAYAKKLDSKIADMKNVAESDAYGGAITAALYLEKFVKQGTKWIHVDFMAYNTASRPGRPEGGEAMGMRALFSLIKQRFAK